MDKDKVIKRVYKILKNVTPIKNDCGMLCDGECCKGDSTTGMSLFPGEEQLFEVSSDFNVIKCEEKNIVVCLGKCDRDMRPISCRIFPLVPIVENEKIYVFDDPRAKGVCPLIYDEIALDKKFEKAVYKVGKTLLKNEETRDFLYLLTDEISEILLLQQNLFE